MVNSIVRRSELVDPEGQGSRYHREQADADKVVRDHADDLFPGLFPMRLTHGNRMLDEEDNVLRCVRCNWEVEGPTCVHCGLAFSDDDEDVDFDEELDDGESLSSDSDEDDEDEDEYEDSFVVPDEDLYENPLLAQIDWTAHFQDDIEFSDEDEDEEMDDEEDSDASTEDDDDDDDDDEDDEDEDEFEEAHEHLPAPTAMVDVDDGDDTIPYYTREDNYYNPPEDTSEQDEDDEDDLPPRRAGHRSHVLPPGHSGHGPPPPPPASANLPSRRPQPRVTIRLGSRTPILIDLEASPPPSRQTARRGMPRGRVQSSRRGRPHVIESESD
jgi:hypothetical protein